MSNETKSRFFSGKILFVVLAMLIAMNANGQWVQMNNGLPQNEIILSFNSSGNYIYAGTGSGVYVSTNSGVIWTQTALNNQGVTSIVVNNNNIYAGTNNGVFVSTNNGNSWTQTGSFIHNVLAVAVSGNYVFAGTDAAGVYRTTNNGISWFQTSLNDRFVWTLAVNGNNLFAGGDGFYVSTDSGANWSQSYLNKIISSLSISGSNLFAGTNGYGVNISTNNGINWVQTSLNNKSVYSLATINNNIFAGLSGSITDTCGVYISTSNGSSWINISQGLSFNIAVRTLLIANNYVFAGTQGQSVWRRPLSEIIGIQNIGSEMPSSFSLSQNYPNPFNPATKIKFAMPKVGDVKIVVYDVQGKEVQTLVNEKLQPGSYETVFDAGMSGLTSGIFFCKLTSEGFSKTIKMLKIK
jgi:Secretion system C-terminal sorting domain